MPDSQPPIGDRDCRTEGSVAQAIAKYLRGDVSELAEMLVAHRNPLLGVARNKLGNAPHLEGRTDADGAVSSAMRSFWAALEDGRYRMLKHGDELYRLLTGIVRHKAAHEIRDLSTEIAGGGKVRNEPVEGLDTARRLGATSQENARSPMDKASEIELLGQWRDYLNKWSLLDVADLVLEGDGYRKIAAKLNIPECKARRSVKLVRMRTREFFGLEETGER